MVVGERFKQIANEGRSPELYFLRTAKGFEIDLLEKGDDGRMKAYEIKSAMSYHKSLVETLEEYAEKWDAESKGMLIYDGRSIMTGSGIQCLNFRTMGENGKFRPRL